VSGHEQRDLREQLEDYFPHARSPVQMLVNYRKPSRSVEEPRYSKRRSDIAKSQENPFSPELPSPFPDLPEAKPDLPQPAVAIATPFPNTQGNSVANQHNGAGRQDPFSDQQSKVTVKTSSGEFELVLNESERAQMVSQILNEKQVSISKEKANICAIAATAFFTGLSALAVGITIYQNARGKKKINLADL
jgi:hypothetical protein